jgi:starch-binding outer membrane protein, SusD/RagB family
MICTGRSHRGLAALSAIACSLAASGCNDLTRVQDPAVVTPADVQSPAGAENLRAGALNSLFGGFSAQSLFTGLLVDEFQVAQLSEVSNLPEDERNLSPGTPGNFPFGTLSNGRVNALIAITDLKQNLPVPAWHIGELYALTAATELEFAENLCSGVSLAVVNGFTPSYGPTYSRQQLVMQALIDLDSAAAYSTGSDSIGSLTAVLRGRALADSGDFVDAAAAVAAVPLGFAYTAELSDTTNLNWIYANNVTNPIVTVSDREGINGLPFASAADARLLILTVQGSIGNIYIDGNVTSGSTPLTMASGIEAQLIAAEAALSSGQIGIWTGILNNLRQNAISPGMQLLKPDSTTTASAALQLAVMFRERAFWLFGTGHRHGDLRRLVRQYGLPVNSVFPTGPYLGGPAQYGSSVVYPVHGDQYNPNYRGCIDANA